jgi:hypothetical protein
MWHHTDWMCFVKYLEPVTAFHFCVCTRHAFYIVMLTSFHRKESKKYLLCAIWTKSHALFHCLGLCSSVLKPLPLFHVLNRVDLPGDVCRISSCPRNGCDCCSQVFTERNKKKQCSCRRLLMSLCHLLCHCLMCVTLSLMTHIVHFLGPHLRRVHIFTWT